MRHCPTCDAPIEFPFTNEANVKLVADVIEASRSGAMTEREILELWARMWEAAGDWVRANWIRSQLEEMVACFERGGSWPEVFVA